MKNRIAIMHRSTERIAIGDITLCKFYRESAKK
jgi:hypothetical protein